MKYKIEIIEEQVIISNDENGLDVSGVVSELVSCIEDEKSIIYMLSSLKPNSSEIMLIEEIGKKVKAYNGLLVLVGLDNFRSKENENIICLPTMHEAKEAIILNDLENQFLKEIGEN